jgi:hypothetical protein
MRQLLVLGFLCEVYKREPLCRVYVNDVLLDEFNIPHTPRKEIEWNSDIILDPKFFNINSVRLQSNPTFCKYIELDNGEATALDLRVEIQNNDNNYANGFVTNYTRVMLSQCFLLSKNTLERLDSIQNDFKFSRKNQHKYYKKKNIVDDYAVPNSDRTGIFDNFANWMNLHFPDITQHPQSEEQLKSRCSNYQDLPTQWQVNPAEHWIGSSGYYHVTLKKKLGFWRLSTDRRRGYWRCGWIEAVKYLYDKYLRYEN